MTSIGSTATSDLAAETRTPHALPFAKIAIGLAALVALMWIGREAVGYVPRFAEWLDELGPRRPAAFVVGYAVAVVSFVPGSVLMLAAGAIFGLVEGTVVVLLGATLGSTAAFVLSRTIAREAVARRVEGDRRFPTIDRAIEKQGRRIVLLLRLSPVFPLDSYARFRSSIPRLPPCTLLPGARKLRGGS